MQAKQLLFPAFSAVMIIATSGVARAGQGDPIAGYKLLTTVSLPGGWPETTLVGRIRTRQGTILPIVATRRRARWYHPGLTLSIPKPISF